MPLKCISKYVFPFVSLIILLAACQGSKTERMPCDITLASKVSFVSVTDDGTITELEQLDSELYSSFFQDYEKCVIHEYWNDPVDVVSGAAILISFPDGSYYLLNHYCTIHFEDGTANDLRQYYNREEFIELWNRYCSIEYLLN